MTSKTILEAIAVARHVETLLPPLAAADVATASGTATDGADDLGPAVTIPAIYLRIIIPAFEAEVLARGRKEMQAVIDEAERKPRASMDEEQLTALAVHLAGEAHARSFESVEAAMALWKAAATIAVAQMPADTVLNALDGIHAMTRADVAQAIGMGATKQ